MKNVIKRIITGIFLGFGFWLAYIYIPAFFFSAALFLFLLHILIVEWRMLFKINEPTFWLLMPIYPVLPFILMILMNNNAVYRELLFLLFVIVSAHDTGAYVFGSVLGKNKITPTISPNKTWEGFAGGFFSACISLVFFLWGNPALNQWPTIGLITLAVCILATLGDLFESWLKRRAHIKDSGDILPGHGGFLDRFDGVLFAIFLFYPLKDYLAILFGKA